MRDGDGRFAPVSVGRYSNADIRSAEGWELEMINRGRRETGGVGGRLRDAAEHVRKRAHRL